MISRPHSTRAMVLLAVMLVLVASCLIGGAVAARSAADVEGARALLYEARARAAAWSGVLAAMVEMEEKRRALLSGGEPEITPSFEISRAGDGVVVTVRAVGVWERGPLVMPQARCVSVNGSPAEMLKATGALGEASAGKVAARSAEREFSSVEEAMLFAGVPANRPAEPAAPRRGPDEARADPEGPLHEGAVLTAYSFDPELMAGVGDAALSGEPRVPWAELVESGADEASLTRTFGADAAGVLATLVTAKTPVASRGELMAALRRAGLKSAWWGTVIDRVRIGESEFVAGRVDLSSASAEVLGCVPGIGSERAGALVAARERLSVEALRSLVWPVTEGIFPAGEFEGVVDRLTTRSAQFRVRMEGVVSAPGEAAGAGRVLARVVYDAVIDISAEPARVAYLRDATLVEVAAHVWATGAPPEPDLSGSPAVGGPGPAPVDRPGPRAQNSGADRGVDADPALAGESSPAPTYGRVGRWSPGPRSRGGG